MYLLESTRVKREAELAGYLVGAVAKRIKYSKYVSIVGGRHGVHLISRSV